MKMKKERCKSARFDFDGGWVDADIAARKWVVSIGTIGGGCCETYKIKGNRFDVTKHSAEAVYNQFLNEIKNKKP